MDNVLRQFTESRFFRAVIEEYNPLAVFLTGSKAIGIDNEFSDYDLCLLTEEPVEFPDAELQYIHKESGACVHYYHHYLSELFINKGQGRGLEDESDNSIWRGLVALGFNPEPLYVREDFSDGFAAMMEGKSVIAKAGLYELYVNFESFGYILNMAKSGQLYPRRYLVYALLIHGILFGGPSAEELAELKELYRLSMKGTAAVDGLSEADRQRCISALKSVAAEFEGKKRAFEDCKAQADEIYNGIKPAD